MEKDPMGNSQARGKVRQIFPSCFRKSKEGLRNCRAVSIASVLGRYFRNFSCKYVKAHEENKEFWEQLA